jgi:hypothetical protein
MSTWIKGVYSYDSPEGKHFANWWWLRNFHEEGVGEILQAASCFQVARDAQCRILDWENVVESTYKRFLFVQAKRLTTKPHFNGKTCKMTQSQLQNYHKRTWRYKAWCNQTKHGYITYTWIGDLTSLSEGQVRPLKSCPFCFAARCAAFPQVAL